MQKNIKFICSSIRKYLLNTQIREDGLRFTEKYFEIVFIFEMEFV